MSFITWQVGILEAPGSQELLNSHFGFSFHLPKVGTNVLTLISSSKWEELELSLVGWDLLAKLLGAQQQEQGESCVGGLLNSLSCSSGTGLLRLRRQMASR